MRYLGNKTSISGHILSMLQSHGLTQRCVFFDAFCGTGAASNALKQSYDIILNDNLLSSLIYAKGRIVASKCKFKNLPASPFTILNQQPDVVNGFFTKNYAPAQSGRMYFTDHNAGRIDFFRRQIEDWHTSAVCNDDEYAYLLCCLLESVSKVANVAGVYGAYLKTWDPRALKDIVFIQPDADTPLFPPDPALINVSTYNANIEDIIADIDCDILYLDPPYTHNSYSVQYHLLETLIRNDNPQLRGLTGARPYTGISNAWSKRGEVEVCLDKVVATTRASHILMSYSSDGIMSKDFILHLLERYCREDSIDFVEIPYKQYKNSRTGERTSHFEYLFYGQKKAANDVGYCCPLNYMGGKSSIVGQIKPHLTGKTKFVDLMGGGFNVGINVNGFQNVVYNDINFIVADLLKMFLNEETPYVLKFIERTIRRYGLTKHGQEAYLKLRKDYNDHWRHTAQRSLYLYVLILYGFQQQIRFNSKYEFNNPVGESGYSDAVKEKIVSFSRRLKELSPDIHTGDFADVEGLLDANTLVYVDPPYLITLGSYNDGKRGFHGWNEKEEQRLLDFVDLLKQRGCKIVMSNIVDYKGKTNTLLKTWLQKHDVTVENVMMRRRPEILVVT